MLVLVDLKINPTFLKKALLEIQWPAHPERPGNTRTKLVVTVFALAHWRMGLAALRPSLR
jgi:hypothetical protein